MLQGALAALVIALIAGVLGYTGLAGPDTNAVAVVFLLVAVFLVAAFIGASKLRR